MNAFSNYLSSAFSQLTDRQLNVLTPEATAPKAPLEEIRSQLDLIHHDDTGDPGDTGDTGDHSEVVRQLCVNYLYDSSESAFQDDFLQKKCKLLDLALVYLKNHHLKAAQIIWTTCVPETQSFPKITHFQPQLFINALHDLGKNGNEIAPYHLGSLFLEGRCVEKNLPTALAYFKASASRGYQPAQDAINTHFPRSLFEQGREAEGLGQLEKAILLYREAADAGDKNAMYRLGKWYLAQKEPKEAINYFKKAHNKGHERAQLQLGNAYAYWHKKSTFPSVSLLDKAKKYYLAEKNGKQAELANFLYLNLLTEEEGDRRAQFLLGKIYFKGLDWIPREKTLAAAKKHITEAADAGHPDAAYFCFIQYEMGTFTSSSPLCDSKMLAVRYYNLAAKNGHSIARLEREMESTPDADKAMTLYHQHSKEDKVNSSPPNKEKAQKYLIIAAEHGSKKALRSVIQLSQTNSIKTPSSLADYKAKLALLEKLASQVRAEKNWHQDDKWTLAVDQKSAQGMELKPWPDHDYL